MCYKIMKLLPFLLMVLPLVAQIGTVSAGGKTWTFSLPAAPPPVITVTSLVCDKTALQPGETSTCTITLSSPAPAAGFPVVPYTADAGLVLNPPNNLIVANGVVWKFSVSRPF